MTSLSDFDRRDANGRARLSRRRFLQATCAGLAALPLAAACQQAPATPSPTAAPAKPAEVKPTTPPATVQISAPTAAPAPKPTEAPKPEAKPAAGPRRGGQLVHGNIFTYPTLDPHLANIPLMMAWGNMFNSLVRYTMDDPVAGTHSVVGDLAESWEVRDPTTVVFKLRRGVKFHDGSEVNAEVVKWNLDRARNHEKSQKRAQLSNVEDVTTPDTSTVQVKLKKPNVAIVRDWAFYIGGQVQIISKAALDTAGEEAFGRNPVGTGPFKFKQWITDDRVIMTKNEDYFENGADGRPLPYLDEVVTRFMPDPTVGLVDLRAGTLHALENVAPKDLAAVRADQNLQSLEMPWAGQVYFLCGFNTEQGVFKDVKVRQAASHGIDRESMARVLGFGVSEPTYYPKFFPNTLGFDPTVPKYEYDPDKVKQLLTEAGHPNGIDIELKVIAREPENTIGAFVQEMWGKVGIRTKLLTEERLTWIESVRGKRFDAAFWRGQTSSLVDPEELRPFITTGASFNWGQWSDPEVDRLMDEGAAEPDERKRAEIYGKVQRRIQEQAYLATGFINNARIVTRKELKDMNVAIAIPDFKRAWLER